MPADPSAYIAPGARVHPDAVIGPGVVVGEFSVIEQDVTIGAGTRLEPYVYVKRWTTLGARNEVSAGTVLGTDPLDKNFAGARSYLRIGDDNKIREHFTISRGTAPESETVIGDGNFIMTSGHIAHNCRIGNRTVIASCALVAGYAEIEDEAFVSGNVAIHQFCKVGRLAMIGGQSGVNRDLPPFFTYEGSRAVPRGLNKVGLKRAGFAPPEISALKIAYGILYRSGLSLEDALARLASADDVLARIGTEPASGHLQHLVQFIRASKRGIARPSPTRRIAASSLSSSE